MLGTGFLGTRADAFVDSAMVVLVAAPFLMAYAIRLARRRRYRQHRNLQVTLLVAGIVAVLLLEGSIRFGSAQEAFALSSATGPWRAWLFFGHLVVAFATSIAWFTLVVLSWRRFTRTLPGPFGRLHRRTGALTFVGLFLTSASGTALYVVSFAL